MSEHSIKHLIQMTTTQITSLRLLSEEIHAFFQQTFRDELTINELLLLAVLFTESNHGVQPSQVAQQLTLRLSATSLLVTALMQKRLITSHKLPTDRRNIFLLLTQTGQQIIQEVWPNLSESMDTFVQQHSLSLQTTKNGGWLNAE